MPQSGSEFPHWTREGGVCPLPVYFCLGLVGLEAVVRMRGALLALMLPSLTYIYNFSLPSQFNKHTKNVNRAQPSFPLL